MKGAFLATVLTIAIAAFVGQFIYKRVFEPAFATQLKRETEGPEHRTTVNEFLDRY